MKMHKSHKLKSRIWKPENITLMILVLGLLVSFANIKEASSSKVSDVSIDGSSVRVIDGDTIHIGNSKIRIFGIDAPELSQICFKDQKEIKCGEASKLALMSVVQMGALKCTILSKDRYKRDVSTCTADNYDIGRLMVSSGWALNYEPYSKGTYKDAELEAKREKRGIWNMNFIEPWNWRKGHRNYR